MTSSEKNSDSTIVWFRQDLRIHDQPTLAAAIQQGNPIIPIYIWMPEEMGHWPLGGASRWWLHHSLISLETDLKEMGLNLLILAGSSLKAILKLIDETNAKTVYWNRCYEPAAIQRDNSIKSALNEKKIEVHSFNGSLLYEPWTILNKQNKPFQIFTYYWKHCLKNNEPPLPLLFIYTNLPSTE